MDFLVVDIAVGGGDSMEISLLHLDWENGVASRRGVGCIKIEGHLAPAFSMPVSLEWLRSGSRRTKGAVTRVDVSSG